MSDEQPLSKNDSVQLDEWAKDLTYKEVHLFTEGFYQGLMRINPKPKKSLQGTVLADSWYFKGGYALGYLAKVFILGTSGVGVAGLLPL